MNIRSAHLIWTVIVLGVLLRVYLSLDVSQWRFVDEEAHYVYVASVHHAHALPEYSWAHARSFEVRTYKAYENYQQPLYYVLAAPFAKTLLGVRFFTIGLWVITVLCVFALTKNLLVHAVLSFLPGIIEVTAFCTNDSLLLCSAAVLAFGLSRRNSALIWVGVCALALSKFTGIVIVGGLLIYCGFWCRCLIFPMSFGLVVGLLAFFERVHLSFVNGYDWQFTSDKIFDMVVGTMVTFTLPSSVGLASFYALVVSVTFLAWFLGRHVVWNRLSLTVGLSVLCVWLAFSFSHVHYLGRLLYPAIPFLLMRVHK